MVISNHRLALVPFICDPEVSVKKYQHDVIKKKNDLNSLRKVVEDWSQHRHSLILFFLQRLFETSKFAMSFFLYLQYEKNNIYFEFVDGQLL